MKEVISFVKEVFQAFSADNAIRLGAALAYYTVFSFAPMIVIVIAVASLVFGEQAVQGELYTQLEGVMGAETATQMQEIVQNVHQSGNGMLATIIGAVTLFLSATVVFGELKADLNTIWGVKAKPQSGVMSYVVNRLLSFGMILTIGFLLLVTLVWDSMITAVGNQILSGLPQGTATLIYILNYVVSFALTAFLFAVIFKVLPDAKIRWRDVITGSMVTAVLFMIGKLLIGLYVSSSDIGSTYGAAGSIVILMVWTYYSAQILFLGAEFTWVYAKRYGSGIKPNEHAVRFVRREVEQPERATA